MRSSIRLRSWKSTFRRRAHLAVLVLERRLVPANFLALNTNDNGPGSLRQAVIDANAAPGADMILFGALFDTSQTIILTSGQLDITDAVSIVGPSGRVTISGNDASRVFDSSAAGFLTAISFSNLVITKANSTADGGALRAEAQAITMTNCLIQGNSANFGGGIYLRPSDSDFKGGQFTAIDCQFLDNVARTTTQTSNATGALGVFGNGSVTVLRRSTFAGNSATGAGAGAITLAGAVDSGPPASVLIEDCAITGNSAAFSGAALSINGRFSDLTIRNSTISGNTAGKYAGIYAEGVDGTLVLQNSTVAFNTATGDGGGISFVKTGTNNLTIALESSVVAKNAAATGPDILTPSTVTYSFSSLYNDSGIGTLTDLGSNRPIGEDPQLLPLADNGGPTQSHRIAFGSPLVNKGSNPANLLNDQRGSSHPRSFNGGVDIGAFELDRLWVDSIADEFDGNFSINDFSLREAVSIAGFDGVYFDPVVFAGSETITLTMGEIAMPTGRTIIGPTHRVTLSGNNVSRIFNLSPSVANAVSNFSHINFINGNAGVNNGGAIHGSGFGIAGFKVIMSNCTVTGSKSGRGGGVSIGSGRLEVDQCLFTGNTSTGSGGGLSVNFTGSTAHIRRSTITGNTALNAGGVYTGTRGYGNFYTLIEDCTIANNTASQQGGGLIMRYDFNTVRNTTISGNTAATGGGVTLLIGATATFQNSSIVFNAALQTLNSGGGIQATVALPLVFLESTIVSKNTGSKGPDIWAPGTVTAKNSSIFNSSGITTFADQGGNRPFGEDPLLLPLADNGGPTQTHALELASPLINRGSNPAALANDQRGDGFPRAFDGTPDIGAFEVQQTIQPANVAIVQVNDGASQRSRVTSLLITFSNPPLMPANPAEGFELRRQSDDSIVTLSGTMIGDQALLTFAGGPIEFGSLADGRYTLTAFASKIANLDANDDGIIGDDQVIVGTPANGLFRLFGDADGDGTVNTGDFLAFRLAFLSNSTVFDRDDSGQVDTADFLAFRLNFLKMI